MAGIKNCIKSRWGDDGMIIEADYSQLEVLGLAYLSGDKQLQKDLKDGLDMHCLNASLIYDTPYTIVKRAIDAGDKDWKKKRKAAKAPGFLIQYGGGAQTMANNTGLPVSLCKDFIKKYYARYVGVKIWQDTNIALVEGSRVPSAHKTEKGYPAGMGMLKSVTGRMYSFIQFDAPDFLLNRGVTTSFSPTQIKNYPVQGFATGDIVPHMCGVMHRTIWGDDVLKNKCLLINTVHDSLIFDCMLEILDEAMVTIKHTLEEAPAELKKYFDLDFDMELPVTVEVGPTWGDLYTIELG